MNIGCVIRNALAKITKTNSIFKIVEEPSFPLLCSPTYDPFRISRKDRVFFYTYFEINLGVGVDVIVLSNFFFGIHIFFDIGKGHY